MLSWLMAAASRAVVNEAGRAVAETVVFPSLDGVSVWDAQGGGSGSDLKAALNPTMPNRFSARVPSEKAHACARAAEEAFRNELKNIADSVWEKELCGKGAKSEWKRRWDRQIELLPEITWQICPIGEDGYENAYKRCQALLAARRNTRDFPQFLTDDAQEGVPKDALTGKEEAIGDEDFQKKLFSEEKEGPYGAITLVKRFWHKSFLRERLGARIADFYKGVAYESVPDVAKKNLESGNPYVAVLAMGGDKMGEWMSGNRRLGDAQTLEEHHGEFSKRLADFSKVSAKIVEKHCGQLVYAGGDDVLAMLPATRAFDCACDLREKFREAIKNEIADVSCGIAVAHAKYPLQRMVKEAQRAESRAKNVYDRGAFAFSLLKRGGEIIHWGGKWGGAGAALFREYCGQMIDGDETVSGRFPYALAGALAPYALEKGVARGLDVPALLSVEANAVAERQISEKQRREQIRNGCSAYAKEIANQANPMWEDFVKLFLTAAFILRKRGGED